MIVHIQEDQLLIQLLIEQLDTLPSQYRHIGHLNKEVDVQEINFDKMAVM